MSEASKPADPELHAAPLHVPLEWDTPMYRLAVDQLDQTAELMNLDPNIWERLRTTVEAACMDSCMTSPSEPVLT